jgi:AcrR family transcriptional regulator
MASKDRILRHKEETRINILEAAYAIVQEVGWQGLSMRKIADKIEYTAPIIYEYFSNKEAIIEELTAKGFIKLTKELEKAKAKFEKPEEQLEAMWMAYWNFAFTDTVMYQVMYGVQMSCCTLQCSASQSPYKLISDTIAEIMKNSNPTLDVIKQKYFTFFSVIHGLISINIINKSNLSESINALILKDAIGGIIKSIQ